MTEETLRQSTCCFTGHRADKLHRSEKEIRKDLKEAITQAIDDGYTTFITGMAYGVDLWAGELVLEKRRWNRKLKLVAAVPFQGFESRWSDRWRWHYNQVLKKANEAHYICDGYASFAYQKRNEWMVDHSSRVIAVYNGEAGGTRNTIRYAEKKEVPIVLLEG